MNSLAEREIETRLFELADPGYREFHGRLVPGIDRDNIIGVRVPHIRRLAAEYSKKTQAAEYLNSLPHRYYEENNLHGLLIEKMTDFDACAEALDVFLPFVDNWATCDIMTPKIFKKHLSLLLDKIRGWLCSDKTYTVRFGLRMLMCFFLDDSFTPDCLDLAAGVRGGEYYVDMMLAWFFATALAKQYDAALAILTSERLSRFVHNKTIQKAVESLRIDPETKSYLKSLRRQGND